ncbi:fumarate reductase/succinate dehydrogenase flavoprotein subunit [Mycobacterium parmense]|uniref:Fumarate reductase/succinate dehydrogenase flavoprotein-like FrdA n=1 Tax=Mycobacterium parmense TaxID=185642 RepID=A0A7I7YS66_9MYCO|nr:fumarate reductase/succinate dehydrogenase flavoprotein subunit [Mycobacterium parmense]MCV7351841.1 fumarate reductase/succinate dehydrogenase flavoprotein subunit [Mycobacterium parmense]ORW56752.1 oxidoreductase [Mycobacterium parmense]BBZ44688.1 fumarate reductase/succinate dehydrogenase flavoprotein-like FrdA [Mycobacterium parmense]
MQIPDLTPVRLDCDVLVIGGGTAGTMAALSAAEHGAQVLLLEKAHVRHSGALAMGMDGVNNAVIPGKAEPEDYVAEITRANDGIVNQRTVYQTATRGFAMVQRLERYGVKFEKDEHGEYAVRRVHRSGSYVLPMPEGKDVKKALYRVLRQRSMRERIRIENRLMPVRVLTDPTSAGRAVGAAALHTRTGEFVAIGAKAVILATGACGRLGLPASGYLYGTYENPTNAGDGYSMAYHAGAELSGIECFQVNPLIKDYNGPACAYVANPFGGYQVNARGERFVDSDYWSGQMMAEVKSEIDSARGPIYLKVSHLPDETLTALEGILHTTERPTRGTFHANRGHDYRTHDVEMHISEIGLCSGHSASGVWVDEHARTTVPGLYAAGDLACVPHNYMIGAFVFGDLAGTHAAGTRGEVGAPQRLPQDQLRAAHELIYRPLRHPDGPPQPQVEYKLRRFVNDYVAPPKTAAKLSIAVRTFERMRDEIAAMGARNPHELMRAVEVSFIRDCAEMAARSSLTRTESRWGLYHDRADLPGRDDGQWGYHLNLRKDADGGMAFLKRPVAPYIVAVPELDGLPPADQSVRPVHQPELIGGPAPATAGSRIGAAATTFEPPSPRIAEVLALAEPTVADLRGYLDDPDAGVRRTAVVTLTEHLPDGYAAALYAALSDGDAAVRRTGAEAIRELVEVLPDPAPAGEHLGSRDTVVRAAAVYLLAARRAGDAGQYRRALDDPDHRVRIEAVRALVSIDDVAGVVDATGDENREVRIAAAAGLATLGGGAGAGVAVRALIGDPDPLVRAAALAALGELGCGEQEFALVEQALGAPAWQVREGAARALSGAVATFAVPRLAEALADAHLDVRKAAVLGLARFTCEPAARDALRMALQDGDADVRAYARRALGEDG